MSRAFFLLLGLVLASLPLVDATIFPSNPTLSELNLACGGDPALGKMSVNCEIVTGAYVGCTSVDGFCRQCSTEGEDGSLSPTMADSLDQNSPKGATGYMTDQSFQDCGNYYDGTCVVDATSPTGFKCSSDDTKNSCSEGEHSVVPQPGPGLTENPGNASSSAPSP